MNLFIDTNIFLSFYHLSSDDLEELKKLALLVRNKQIVLYVTEQVLDEFRRNRAAKTADALRRLKDQRTGFQFPQFCKDYEDYKSIRDNLKAAQLSLALLIGKVEEDIAAQTLKADDTIRDIYRTITPIPTTDKLFNSAQKRVGLGNPPGKTGSLGDAVNWEALLLTVPKKEDLIFVSDDKDYASPLNDTDFNPFLLDEWKQRKSANVAFYRRLSAFLRDRFPEIRLEIELEKEKVIRELAESPNFASTHLAVSQLGKYSDFSPSQVNEIVAGAVGNNQISWIINDADVKSFLENLIRGREKQIDPATYRELTELFEGVE